MRYILPLALLLTVPLAAGEYDGLISNLENPALCQGAARALVAQGTPALPELREALAAASDETLELRLAGIIKEIELREPMGLRFNAGAPKMRITVADVNLDGFGFSVSVRNRGQETVVLWPYLSLRVLDAQGKEVKPALRRGRWGLGRSKQWLEDVKYVELKPGEAWSFLTPLTRYVHDESFILGWELEQAGTYTLEFTYRFDRAAAKATCDPEWELLDDPERPWNRALVLTHTFSGELRVEGQ